MSWFRLDRVLEAEMLDDTFSRPAGLDSPEAVLNAVVSTPGDEWSVEVLLETRAKDAHWQLPPIGLAWEQAEGGRSCDVVRPGAWTG